MNTTLRLCRRVASLSILVVVAQSLALQAAEISPPSELQLLEILRAGAPAEKAVACKQLAIHGSQAAVPELAKLLADEQLASWSRIALEAIPDSSADAALIEAAETVQGQLLVGVINSIGVRRSPGAVDVLAERLTGGDDQVASAAAIALGKIGSNRAIHSLHESLEGASPAVRGATAEAGILCAERLVADGRNDDAVKLYDIIRRLDVAKQRILEATRGAILARGDDGIPLLVEQLQSSDQRRFALGLIVARELPGQKVAEALADELDHAEPDRAALIAFALGDRADVELPPALLRAARAGDQRVRVAAIQVVGRKGDSSVVPALLEIATDADAQLSQAAKSALAELPGSNVDTELARRLTAATGQSQAVLIETVGERRVTAAIGELVKALKSSDGSIRSAALIALGTTAGPKELGVLIAEVTGATNAADAELAEQALLAASIRMRDREATAAKLAAAMPSASTGTQARLLRVLGAMGGPTALQTITESIRGGDDELQDVATRVLGQWMTPDAAPVLLKIASSDHPHRIRALRGYLRIARQLNLQPQERLEMCAEALKIAARPEERRLVLQVLPRCASPEAIEMAASLLDDAAVRPQAAETMVIVAERIGDRDPAAASAAAKQAIAAGLADGFAQRAQALVKE